MKATTDRKGHEMGTRYEVHPDAIIGRVEGVDSAYGPGGFGVGTVGPNDQGRRETGGPIVAGPWGYLYGRASVIDQHGGTGAEWRKADDEGRWIDVLRDGDVLVIGDNVPMVLTVGRYGRLDLDPESTQERRVSKYGATPEARIAALSDEGDR